MSRSRLGAKARRSALLLRLMLPGLITTRCEESLHLRIAAPALLQGASVVADGNREAVLAATEAGAVLTVELRPFHESGIVI